MEPIAVNHIAVTRELFAESHEAVFSKRRQRMLLSCGIIFLAFGVVLLVLQGRSPVAAALCVPALLSGAIITLWAATLKRSDLKRRYRAFARANGDPAQRTITCTGDGLIVDAGREKPVQIDYADIREHRRTEHLLLLICKNHTGVQLALDGFETGSAEALLAAIDAAKRRAEALRQLEA